MGSQRIGMQVDQAQMFTQRREVIGNGPAKIAGCTRYHHGLVFEIHVWTFCFLEQW